MKTLRQAKREGQLQHYGKTNIEPEVERRRVFPPLPPEKEKVPILEQALRKNDQMGFERPSGSPTVHDGIGAIGNRGPVFFFSNQMKPWLDNGHDQKIRSRVIELIRIHGHQHVLYDLINQSSLKHQIMEVVGDLF